MESARVNFWVALMWAEENAIPTESSIRTPVNSNILVNTKIARSYEVLKALTKLSVIVNVAIQMVSVQLLKTLAAVS